MTSLSESTPATAPAGTPETVVPERPAWLNFEQSNEEEDTTTSKPKFTSDPRGQPSEKHTKATSVAMEEDELQIEGQRYAVISFVSPNGTFQHSDQMLLKIRGVFATLQQARERAEIIKTFDSVFDMYIIDMYRWIPFPPKANIHREGDERVSTMLNNFFERSETSQAELRQRVEQTREAGKKKYSTEETSPSASAVVAGE